MAGTTIKIAHLIATATIVSSTVEADLVSITIPSNALGIIGNGVRLELGGTLLNNSTAARTIRFRFKYDDTTILASTAISLAQSANRRKWNMNVLMVAPTDSAQRVTSVLAISAASTATFAPDGLTLVGYSTGAEFAGAAKIAKVTAALSFSTSVFDIKGHVGVLELLR